MPSDMRDLEDEFAELENLGKLDDLDKELGSAGEPNVRRKESLRILPITIAAMALVLFVVVVWYAYSQGIRSGSEVSAPLLTPDHAAKELPEDPGGMKVPHQDKLVYNQLEEQIDDSQVERLLPPPEQPIKPPAAKPVVKSKDSDTPPIPSITGVIPKKEKSSEPLLINPDAEKEAAVAVVEPKKNLPEPEVVVKKVEEKITQTVVETTKATREVTVPVVKDKVINKAADWRIQIGAVGSDAKARSEFKRHQTKHKDLLGKLSLEVQNVKVNSKDYFRIRIGPLADVNAAKKLCDSLKKRSIDCIPVAPGK